MQQYHITDDGCNYLDYHRKIGILELYVSEHKYPGENFYTLQLLATIPAQKSDSIIPLPEKFLHVCEVCGREELLSPEEAFDAGWDYPPLMGEFGVLSPRTCGSCVIRDTVYWKVASASSLSDDLTDNQVETLRRIFGEPATLFPSDES